MPEDKLEKLLKELNDKIEILTKVTGIQVGQDKSVTERARLLKMAGMDNQTIADVLNTSVAAVRTYTTNLRVRRS
jgi:hypothetical protein